MRSYQFKKGADCVVHILSLIRFHFGFYLMKWQIMENDELFGTVQQYFLFHQLQSTGICKPTRSSSVLYKIDENKSFLLRPNPTTGHTVRGPHWATRTS